MTISPDSSAYWRYMESYWPQWPEIWVNLQKEPFKVLWLNPFIPVQHPEIQAFRQRHERYHAPELPFELYYPRLDQTYEPALNSQGLLIHYMIDPMSLRIACSLPLKSQAWVLDACSAPGGKSLALYHRIKPLEAQLISNEPNPKRRKDLFWVTRHWIPKPQRLNLRITGYPAQKFGKLSHRIPLDAALVDAPCSHDRQLARSPHRLFQWHEGYPKHLAKIQYEILCAIAHNLKPGGFLLYSVCTLSFWETQHVVERFLNKFGHEFEKRPLPLFEGFHQTISQPWGTYVLPGEPNFGPFFVSLFQKI